MVTLEAYPKIEVAALKDIPVPINISTQPHLSPTFAFATSKRSTQEVTLYSVLKLFGPPWSKG
jgi:hypothetical protein